MDNSADVERFESQTVRLISAAETEVQNQAIPCPRAGSLRTDWVHERRRTAPCFPQQNQRLNSLNVGGGATTNRTTETRFALHSGRWAASRTVDLGSLQSRNGWKADARRRLRGGAATRHVTGLSRLLDWRAGCVAVRAEYAAIALQGAQHRSAMAAVIEELASIRRHRLFGYAAALRASEG